MKWDKYIQALNLLRAGELSPTVTKEEVVTDDRDHAIVHLTFEDGAVLKFEQELPAPRETVFPAPPAPHLQVLKPPDKNPYNFRVGEIHVLELRKENN